MAGAAMALGGFVSRQVDLSISGCRAHQLPARIGTAVSARSRQCVRLFRFLYSILSVPYSDRCLSSSRVSHLFIWIGAVTMFVSAYGPLAGP